VTALRSRILARFTELEEERAAVTAQFAQLERDRQPAPDTDLLDQLPALADLMATCPPGSTARCMTRSASSCSTATT